MNRAAFSLSAASLALLAASCPAAARDYGQHGTVWSIAEPDLLAQIHARLAEGRGIVRPHERTFPYEGLTEFRALETQHRMLVNPTAIRREYQERMDQFLTKVRGTLTAAGVDYHLAETDHALEETLLELLVARSRLVPVRRRA